MSFTSSSSEHPAYSTTTILKEICKHLCQGIDPADSARIAKRCIETVRMHDVSADNSLTHCDEFSVCERIKKHLRTTGSEQDAERFDVLHRKLLRVSQAALSNRTAILSFFLRLSEARALGGSVENGNLRRLERDITSRAFDVGSHVPTATTTEQDRSTNRSRAGADVPYRSPNFKGAKIMSSTAHQTSNESKNFSNGYSSRELLTMNVNTDRRRGQRLEQMVEPFTKLTSPSTHRTSGKYDVSELQILQELLFCFQGIEGKVLRSDTDSGFKIDPLANVSHAQTVRHLAELGHLHDQVTGLSQELGQGGTVARSLSAAVRDQVTDLYSGVTHLHSELRQSVSLSEDSPLAEEAGARASLTLRRLLVWLPLWRFQVLSDICRACVGLRGGAIVSAAFPFSYHGDPQVQAVATSILAAATRPLFTLICHWIVQGELYDPYDEFFVAINKMCPPHNRWKDKFFLRNELIPAVMTEEQAMMVLNAGKCINFLNEICQNKMPVTGARAKLRQLESNHEGELLQLAEPASPLAVIVESAFMEASRLVLDTLKTQFKLFENFQGLRRYMLLGQGDFYRYLMELLQPELNKSVSEVYTHNLISILESAIRATNAQFEDKDILERVSVTLLEPSQGETGWDTFTMIYCTDGPLDTVFQLSEGTYKHMFRFLWELKRVEYLLSNFRKDQSCVLKRLRRRSDFSDLKALLNYTSLMTAEMVHYISQVQYYILFEVIECAFEKFAKKFAKATTIEEVIHDHELFLEEIRKKTLKDDSDTSKKLSSLMQALNMSILDLLSHGSQFLCDSEAEVARRETRERLVEQHGTDFDEEKSHKRAVQTFTSRTQIANTQITLACQGYKDNVRKLLVLLSRRQDDLQLLSTRLDFNEFYKRSEPELMENVKFRKVSIFRNDSLKE